MTRSPQRSRSAVMSSASGASASSMNVWPAWTNIPARAGPELFPPEVVVQVKALACELPATLGVPLSRLSTADIVREAQRHGIVATVSDKTVWRWLHEDAIRPWQHRTWIFPRDPDFAHKAGRMLDLYARSWDGHALTTDDFVLSADEKTSIQARLRKHASTPPRCVQRLQMAFLNLIPVHGPIHASWLNQIEIYFSIVQRKALTPNDFQSLEDVEERLLAFQAYYERIARPFEWRFTKDDLAALMRKLDSQATALAAVA